MILVAWWSGLALLCAFLFAGLVGVTDRPSVRSTSEGWWQRTKAQADPFAEKPRYELDDAA